MPGKRKQAAPRKADEQKRQCLAWNMQDMFINNSGVANSGQVAAGPSTSHLPTQIIPQRSQGSGQSDGLTVSADDFDQSNGLCVDQPLGSELLNISRETKSVHFGELSVIEVDVTTHQSDEESFQGDTGANSLINGLTLIDADQADESTSIALTDPTDGYDFFLTVFDSVDEERWHCRLGTIVLNLFSIDGSGNLPKVLPPLASPVLYVFEHTEKHVLHLESLPDLEYVKDRDCEGIDEPEVYIYATTDIGVSLLAGLAYMYKKKAAQLMLEKYDPLQGTLELHVYLLQEALSRPQFASEGLTGKGVSRKLNRILQELMEWFLGIPMPESYSVIHKKRQDVDGLYHHVGETHQGEDRSLTLDPQHHSLVPSLRPYQKEAILWMLEMEQYGKNLQEESRERATEIHLLWREVQLPDGHTLFYNTYTGSLCEEKPSSPVPTPGGILADEMGLGKTVEVLALMLLHPRPDFHTTATVCTLQQENGTPTRGERQEQYSDREDSSAVTCSKDTNYLERSRIDLSEDKSEAPEAHLEVERCTADRSSDVLLCTKVADTEECAMEIASCHHVPQEDGLAKTETKLDQTFINHSSVSVADSQTSRSNSREWEGKAEVELSVSCSEKSTNVPHSSSTSVEGNRNEREVTSRAQACDVDREVKMDSVMDNNMCNRTLNNGITVPSSTTMKSCEGSSACEIGDLSSCISEDSVSTSNSKDWNNLPRTGTGDSDVAVQKHTVPLTLSTVTTPPTKGADAHVDVNGTPPDVETGFSIVNNTPSVCDQTGSNPSEAEKMLGDHLYSSPKAKGKMYASPGAANNAIDSVPSMECSGEGATTTHGSGLSCAATSTTFSQEQPWGVNQIQEQQSSTSRIESQQQKQQKDLSKKPASQKKTRKSKRRGAAAVEPVCIPAPERCNLQSTHRFECICGVTDTHVDSRTRLQCWKCGNWQHAECVNCDVTSDLAKMVEPYHCPHCCVSLPAVQSGATLIISPAPISHQWVDEINRHVRKAAIKMLVYSGVKRQGFLQPKALADHDIVITTYDVLRLELNYVDIPHSNSSEGRRFRHQKRYMAVPSPLPSVEWWRVCLDEAQMVECTTAKAAEMALRLSAVNRWCVTGTPIQRNLEDLYGLLLFLGVDPYWVKHWWERLLYQPYCHGNPQPMYDIISKVMWRTAKKDVLDQINLPQQSEDVHWLKFSPVEEHFYRRKHEDCSRHAFKVLSQWHDPSTKLCQLDRRTMHTMLWPLLKLRQACCHPQAVRGEFLPLHKSTMTMDELLKSLTQKCKVECEEAHRQLICALNGLAGIHIIKEEYPEAVEKYREVLRSVQEHEGRLKTDKLQRLHTLHNLAGVLQRDLPGVPPTLRDGQLLQQAAELKTHYMQKSLDKILASQQTLLPIQQKVRQLHRKLQPGTPWWMDTLQWAIYWGKDEDLAERIRNELSGDRDTDATSIVNKFRDVRGLQFLLTSQLENLQQSHAAVCQAVNHLSKDPSQLIIQAAVECHLRPEKGEELHNCEFCKADDLFLEYESRLFSFTAKRLEDMVAEEEENPERQVTRRGVWAQSETEKCLKIVLSFCKSSRLEEQWVEEGNMQMELFEQLRREYKQLHVVWMALRDRVASIDELDMATTRLRLRLPEEERTDPPQPNIIEPGEVDHQWLKNLNDKAVATSLLHRKLGQLLYLRNLAKSQEYQKDGVNPEPCPICQKELGAEWSVLMCGHCFCEECISVLVNQFGLGGRRGSIRCAICRQLTATRDISYVSTAPKHEEADVDVKGSHSTKVEAVVRTLKLIQQKQPTAKSLVFSTWQDVLDVVATALRDNSMEYRAINGIHRFQENLTDFKYDSRIGVLLLPLHTGSHGLNIIEATHVLLVEPIINPAQELQAIGRVHRIGQTKPTVVHRFLVQNTIEERIHAMKKHISASDSIDTQSEGTVLTVGDMRDLFSDAFHHREDDTPPPPQQEYEQNNGTLQEFDDEGHLHGDSDGGHLHGDSDGDHLHGDSDGGHLHGDSDGGHLHGDSDGDHLHGDSDGGHLHGDSDGGHLRGDDADMPQ